MLKASSLGLLGKAIQERPRRLLLSATVKRFLFSFYRDKTFEEFGPMGFVV